MRLNNLLTARWKLAKPYRIFWFWGLLTLLFSVSIELVLPVVVAFLVDNVSQQNSVSHFHLVVLLAIGALAVQAFLSAISQYSFDCAGNRISRDIRQTAHEALVKREISFFDGKNVPELSQRLNNDIDLLSATLNVNLARALKATLLTIGCLAMITWLSFQLSLIVAVLVPFSLALRKIVGQHLVSKSHRLQQKVTETSRLAQEDFTKVRLIHAYNQQDKVIENYAKSTQSALLASLTTSRILALFRGGLNFVRYGSLLVVLWIGVSLIQFGELTLGSLTSFILYTTMIASSASTLSQFTQAWKKATNAYKRIVAVLGRDLVEEKTQQTTRQTTKESTLNPRRFRPINAIRKFSLVASKDWQQEMQASNSALYEVGTVCDFSQHKLRGGAAINPQHGTIEFRNVHFAYPSQPSKPALTNFNLRIREGERVALVGATGAGKSTIANLLLGFYAVNKGQICLDGVDVNEMGLQSLREQLAIVEQDPVLHSGTILQNIAFSAEIGDIDEGDVFIAARRANADEFIQKFPDGYDTIVGKRGVTLTAGQKQRIAIARALFKDPRILILDEATSALDSASEFKVQQALDMLMRGRTTIVIANRLSTVVKADRIVVMEQGEILQEGSHAELSEDKQGPYQKLIRKYYRTRVG